jgi:hypothetical protein
MSVFMTSFISAVCEAIQYINPFSCCNGCSRNSDDQRVQKVFTRTLDNTDQVEEEIDYKLKDVGQLAEQEAFIGPNNHIFEQMLKDLNSLDGENQLTEYQHKIAKETIEQYQTIDASLTILSGNDSEINKKINQLTRAGAEGGFGAVSPQKRVEAFIYGYQLARDQSRLHDFFACFTRDRDTCLSHKTENLYKFVNSLQIPDVDLSIDPNKALEVPSYVLSLMMSDKCFARFNDEIPVAELRKYLLGDSTQPGHLYRFAAEFQRISVDEDDTRLKAFLDYLSERGMHNGAQVDDWIGLLLRFIDSDAFDTAHVQALTYL